MNVRCLFFVFSLAFILWIHPAFSNLAATTKETPDPDSSAVVQLNQHEFFGLQDSSFVDSASWGFKEMDYLNGYPGLYLGNSGHAQYSVLYQRHTSDPSLFGGFDSYFRKTESIAYYHTDRPYSNLTFINGAKREQVFNLLHTQNFGEHFNIKLDLTKRGSIGFYNHLKTNNTFFDFSTNFLSKNQRYSFLAFYYINRINAQENGGFDDFESVNNPDLSGTTRLDNAANRVKDQRYSTRHSYRFGKTTAFLTNDSVEQLNFSPKFEIAYSFQYGKMDKSYEDNALDTAYYPAIFIDSAATFDSVFRKTYENEVILSLLNGRYAFFGLSAGHQFLHHYQTILTDTSYNNYYFGAFLRKQFKKTEGKVHGRYVVDGYNEGDITANVFYGSRKFSDSTKALSFSFDLLYELKEPDYFLTNYESNHFRWINYFEKSSKVDLRAGLQVYKFSFELGLTSIDKLVYFDTDARPKQWNENLQITAFTVIRNFQLGHFHLDNRLTFQQISNEEVLPLPSFVANESFYYQNYLLKKALLTRIGANVFYYTDHHAMSYMPVLNQFHLTSDDAAGSLGNYPYVTLFLDLKIKRMKLYFMSTHVNKGFSGNQFYRVPGYPLPPRAFGFGFNWTLLP